MTRMDSMLSRDFASQRRVKRPPRLSLRPSRSLFFAVVVVPACALAGYGLGEILRLLR